MGKHISMACLLVRIKHYLPSESPFTYFIQICNMGRNQNEKSATQKRSMKIVQHGKRTT